MTVVIRAYENMSELSNDHFKTGVTKDQKNLR